jgi:dTDP-4-dehydrorhamnose reductase
VRIEVIGARGQLGRELLRVLSLTAHQTSGHDLDAVDVTNAASVARLLDTVAPDAVINCAAWTEVDAAEANAEAARAVNGAGPGILAEACHDRDILLCHLSTDYVFDGRASAPIDETAIPSPRSTYGRTKLAGEEAVRQTWARSQIVRTAWLYGQEGPNFVLTMLRLAREGRVLRVVADQRGSPTWTGHLAPALVRLVERGTAGTYHLTNSGVASWYEFAEAIVHDAGLRARVEPITTSEYPVVAERPAYSVLDNRAWRRLGEAPLPDWREGLRGYLSQRGLLRDATG